jgi:hypothetical protein
MILFQTDKIKERISSTTTFNPMLHMAHINRAYRNQIEKFFPEDKYEELEDELDTPLPGDATDEQKTERKKKEKLFSHFYDALANLGYYYTIPHLEVTVTSGGIVSIKTADREKADARQIIRLEKSFAEAGLENLDRMLKFLDKESGLFDWFPAVFNGSGHRKLIVSSADTFQQAVDINSSFLVFAQLRPVIRHVEDLEVIPIIGQATYDVLLNAIAAEDEAFQLQQNVRAYISLRAMADGLRMKDVGMNEKGIYQIFIENKDYGKHPAAMPAVTEKINMLNQLALQYKEKIESVINPEEEGDGIVDLNKEDSGFFHTWG